MSHGPESSDPRPRRWRAGVALVAAILAGTIVAMRVWWPRASRPSILLISIDTCRADRMGFLGGRRFTTDGSTPTPNLDRLASLASGPRSALSPVPLTLPAHTSVFGGLYPDATGVRENDSFRVPNRAERGYSLLAEELRAAGYDTGAVVSGQPLERVYGLDAGFRFWSEPPRTARDGDELGFRERRASATTDEALRFLAENREGPWFLFVHFFDPHHPYERDRPRPTAPPGRDGDYLAEIMAVDDAVGRLLDRLGPALDETLVVVFSDHGEGLGEHGEETHGYLLHDATLSVPLIVKPPKSRSLPARELPARLVDLHPTILALSGVQSRDGVDRDGRSLTEPPERDWIAAAETLYPYYQFVYARERALRDETRKLVEGGGSSDLFAWREDPGETRELAAGEPRRVEGLRERQRRHLARPRPGRAADRDVVPSAAVPYFGGRPRNLPIEPTETENASLPRVATRFEVIEALDAARNRIRDRRAAEAIFLLSRHQEERERNPSLLFWTARAEDRAADDLGLGLDTRLGHLDTAAAMYERHAERYDDGKGIDALIRVKVRRFELSGRRDDLEAAIRVADAEIARGRGRALTHSLRAVARELGGDRKGAIEDFEAAIHLDPDDPRPRERLAALRRG